MGAVSQGSSQEPLWDTFAYMHLAICESHATARGTGVGKYSLKEHISTWNIQNLI